MKKIALLAIFAMASCFTGAYATGFPGEAANDAYESPQVCQFSLSSYSGTVNNGATTEMFTVGLSCPQKSSVYATVVAFIDNEHVASKVVEVKAGATSSSSVYLNMGTENIGKRYKLVVQ